MVLAEGDDSPCDVDEVRRCRVGSIGGDDDLTPVTRRLLFDRRTDGVPRDGDQSQRGVRIAEARILQKRYLFDRVIETRTSRARRRDQSGAVDELHRAPAEVRADLLARHRSTNYSVVDIELIDELYRAEYAERVSGDRRLFMRRASSVDSVVDTATGINVVVRDHISGATDTLECDALVLATGFEPAPLRPILGELAPTQTAEQIVSRDYRLATPATVTAGIYLQGGTEKTHGITSSLLSNVAVRAGEILDSVVTGRGGEGCSVRVDPSTETSRRVTPATTFAGSATR